MPKILAFAGSARSASLNKKLVQLMAAKVREHAVEVTVIDLRDYPMPLYDGDLEEAQGLPEATVALRTLMLDHQGLLLACPEYNSSITPLLKNTIDWVSRPLDGESGLLAFKGKVAGLVATSPGALGGMRGLVTVRSILGNIGVHVIPTQVVVGGGFKVFADDGPVTDEALEKRLGGMAAELALCTRKLHATDADTA